MSWPFLFCNDLVPMNEIWLLHLILNSNVFEVMLAGTDSLALFNLYFD
jgi:hypothetical protein